MLILIVTKYDFVVTSDSLNDMGEGSAPKTACVGFGKYHSDQCHLMFIQPNTEIIPTQQNRHSKIHVVYYSNTWSIHRQVPA